MSGVVVLCGAVLGGCVGTVTPRIAYRLSVPHGAQPMSGCTHCGRAFPTGPGGWLRAGPACAGCPVRPAVLGSAALGAAVFAALGWAFGSGPALLGYLAAAAVGILLGYVDAGCLRLPDRLVGGMLCVAGVPLTALALVAGQPHRAGRAVVAAVVCFLAYLLLALLPRAPLGFGDVKLAGVLGFLLGWLGWPAVLLGVALPHLLNGPAALVMLATGRAGRRTALPFGPALLAGAWLAVVATS